MQPQKNRRDGRVVLEMLIPEDWLKAEFEKHLTEEELKKIDSLGGLEKLLEEFKKRMEDQEERHEGGSKYIGTGGTSPFGNSGENPEGIRVGGEGGKGKAAKVWEARDFKNRFSMFKESMQFSLEIISLGTADISKASLTSFFFTLG